MNHRPPSESIKDWSICAQLYLRLEIGKLRLCVCEEKPIMNEERVQILKMLQEGRITVEEAARLIDALSADTPAPAPLPAPSTRSIAIPIEQVPPEGESTTSG